MSQATAYSRLSGEERKRVDHPVWEGITALRRLLPLSQRAFERRLGRAMAEAERRGIGFYLDGFAASRALGSELWLDIDPLTVDRRLEHRFRQDGRALNIRGMFLGAGDWTPLLRRLDRSTTHREVADVVEANFDYRATSSYQTGLERARGPKPMRRNYVVLSSPAKVEAYFRQTAEMCRSIGEVGLVRRKEFGRRMSSFASPTVRLPWIELGEVDIGVAVGPAGELYRFASGKHRTAAAQALKLKSMPVEVRLVHCRWLARHMAETGLGPLAALRRGLEALSLAHSAKRS